MIDSLYNPDSMSREDIKNLFVARQPLLGELTAIIKNQRKGAGLQHVLIIAPRGMGKTTMLLMLQFAIEENERLKKNWQAVRFPEESYGITELADFWLKVLSHLAETPGSDDIKERIIEIENHLTKSEDLREAAWSMVKDWSVRNNKRVVLLIDNFDMILTQIGNQTEQARLRDILMNDGSTMLIGCAPSYFQEIQDYEQPLYNFFKIYNLSDLKYSEIEELLRRRAGLDDIPNIEELLKKNKTRIRALEAFTGGNPRLVLMLYRIITSSDMTEVKIGLERLLDAVTPFYKDKTEKLPPQQRKIVNEIAQYGLEKREGISATEIAHRLRMKPNQISTQLKRLAENGYVRSLNIRGRSTFYAISEPLYAIWAQMRFGRTAREKRNWLVQILKALYDSQEIQVEIAKLGKKIGHFSPTERNDRLQGTVEYLVCLIETNPGLIETNFELAVNSYLELNDLTSLKAIIASNNIFTLSEKTLSKLRNTNIISRDHLITVVQKMSDELIEKVQADYIKASDLFKENEFGKVEKILKKIIEFLDQFIGGLEVKLRKEVRAVLSPFDFFLAISLQLMGDVKLANNDLNQANDYYHRAIAIYDEITPVTKRDDFFTRGKMRILMFQFAIQMFGNDRERATEAFAHCVEFLKEYDSFEMGMTTLTHFMVSFASRIFDVMLIREVILEAGAEELFFPLIRAIDYLKTNDKTLIEKLSPEIRLVVDETLQTLKLVEEEKTG